MWLVCVRDFSGGIPLPAPSGNGLEEMERKLLPGCAVPAGVAPAARGVPRLRASRALRSGNAEPGRAAAHFIGDVFWGFYILNR